MVAMVCERSITETGARSFYERLVATQGADGCTLDEVATENTRMTVVWKKQGSALPAAEIVHEDCAASDAVTGPTLAMRVPEALRTACPATVGAAIAVVQREAFETFATSTRPPVALRGAFVALPVAVATALFIVAMVLRHRRPATSSR
jgi:hypothetical protein